MLRPHPRHALGAAVIALSAAFAASAGAASPYTLFETGQVRPLALSADGTVLFAVNTPDGRLEIFRRRRERPPIPRLGARGRRAGRRGRALQRRGLGGQPPLRQRQRRRRSAAAPRPDVVRTLLVGDEPRDIVFAGPAHDRAFVTTAHRGQNNPNDPQLTTPGRGPGRRVGVRRGQPRRARSAAIRSPSSRSSATRRARSP